MYHRLRRGAPQQRETRRRSGGQEKQGTIVGEGREQEGEATIGNSLRWSVFMPAGLEGGAALQRLQVVRRLLLI